MPAAILRPLILTPTIRTDMTDMRTPRGLTSMLIPILVVALLGTAAYAQDSRNTPPPGSPLGPSRPVTVPDASAEAGSPIVPDSSALRAQRLSVARARALTAQQAQEAYAPTRQAPVSEPEPTTSPATENAADTQADTSPQVGIPLPWAGGIRVPWSSGIRTPY
jgi:hypothetical protein